MSERFKYRRFSRTILDDLTGFIYNGDEEVCKLMNQIDKRGNHNAELLLDDSMKLGTKYELLNGIRKLLLDVPCCHHCPESHLDDAVGWMCKEQNWKELSELYGEDYNPYKVADECEYMKGWW